MPSYVRNPETGRQIKVGGDTWLRVMGQRIGGGGVNSGEVCNNCVRIVNNVTTTGGAQQQPMPQQQIFQPPAGGQQQPMPRQQTFQPPAGGQQQQQQQQPIQTPPPPAGGKFMDPLLVRQTPVVKKKKVGGAIGLGDISDEIAKLAAQPGKGLLSREEANARYQRRQAAAQLRGEEKAAPQPIAVAELKEEQVVAAPAQPPPPQDPKVPPIAAQPAPPLPPPLVPGQEGNAYMVDIDGENVYFDMLTKQQQRKRRWAQQAAHAAKRYKQDEDTCVMQ